VVRLPDIDETGLRQYFGFDHMLGDRTWWRDISLLPPASIWHVTGPVTRRTQYWSFDDLPERRCPLPEAQAEFGRLWDQAVRDYRRPGTTPVLLSGGLDSRLLVAELLSQDAPIVAVTYGSTASASGRRGIGGRGGNRPSGRPMASSTPIISIRRLPWRRCASAPATAP
jgi:hypothetical protein